MRPDVLEDDVCVSLGSVFPVVDAIKFKDGSHFVLKKERKGDRCGGGLAFGVRRNGRQWNLCKVHLEKDKSAAPTA